MWFYHRRTSVCLAPLAEEAYRSDRPLFSSAWHRAAGPANLGGEPAATSPTPDLADGVSMPRGAAERSFRVLTTLCVFMYALSDGGETLSTIFKAVLILYPTISSCLHYNITMVTHLVLSRAGSVIGSGRTHDMVLGSAFPRCRIII